MGRVFPHHYDFSSTLLGSILAYPGDDGNSSDGEFPLLEMDACIRGKMFSDKSWFVPYVQAGVGFSKYQGYWNAFIPAGLGLQIGFFGEAYLQHRHTIQDRRDRIGKVSLRPQHWPGRKYW